MQHGFEFSGKFSHDHKDVVFTPPEIARAMVSHFPLSGRVLDPCRGDGAFWSLIDGADYCELQDGRDFFQYKSEVNWIIGNPPYSIYFDWMLHSMSIAKNIVYLIPITKTFNFSPMLKSIYEWGGIAEIVHIGSGRSLNFPFGFAVGAVHYK